jgi:LysM repeat protein
LFDNSKQPSAGKRRTQKGYIRRISGAALPLISLLLIVGVLVPAFAYASVLSTILNSIKLSRADAETITTSGNLQTMALADIERPKNSTISTYVVREGDTLSEIAELFEVTPSTILWANDLPRNAVLKVGQQLTILPVTGVRYTVKSGDTLSSIAKKYSGDAAEIGSFNGIDDSSLAVGSNIIIPDGEIAAPPPPAVAKRSSSGAVTVASTVQSGFFAAPLARYIKTQGIHGYNGVDLAAAVGTPIYAAAAGNVIVAKSSGYNGGYGKYIVIQHDNGSQTLYGHASSVSVSVGERVVQGQKIGGVGNTGKSTGSHLHFEIRNGGRNPF